MTNMLYPSVVPVNTTGGAGAATGSADHTPSRGAVLLNTIHLDYHASAPATTTVTITFPDMPGSPSIAIPAGNTDRVVRPRVPVQLASAPTTDIVGRNEEKPVVYGRVNTAVGASNALTPAVTARFYYES